MSISGGEAGEGAGEDFNAFGDLVGARVFVGTVAPAAAAGDENHFDRAQQRHEERVVVGAADHAAVFEAGVFRGGFGGFDETGIADGGGVGVDGFDVVPELASLADRGDFGAFCLVVGVGLVFVFMCFFVL